MDDEGLTRREADAATGELELPVGSSRGGEADAAERGGRCGGRGAPRECGGDEAGGRALFVSLRQAVREMKDLLEQSTVARDVRVAQPVGVTVLNYQRSK